MAKREQRYFQDDFLAPADEALLERVLMTDHPQDIDGLVQQPPNTSEVPEILFAYDTRPPGGRRAQHKPNQRCVFGSSANHTARHWKGFVVRWEGGERAQVGRNCGAKHFGFEFESAVLAFDRLRTRQLELQRVVDLRSILPDVTAELGELRHDPAIQIFDECRHRFRRLFPELNEALGAMAHLRGKLRATRFERNHDAEYLRAVNDEVGGKLVRAVEDTRGKSPGAIKAATNRLKRWMEEQQPIFKPKVEELGAITGYSFITSPMLLSHEVATAATDFSDLNNQILSKRSDYWGKTNPFSATFDALRKSIARVDRLSQRIEEARRFSSAANLKRISEWTFVERNSKRPKIYHGVESNGRSLICPNTEDTWSFPSRLLLRPLPKLEGLRIVMS